jgi:predicted dienelactone hydrolase
VRYALLVLLVACARPTPPSDAASPDAPPPDAAPDAATKLGCSGTDPALPGPWPVGVRTITLAGLTVEIWYPAVPGSEKDHAPIAYDLAAELPPRTLRHPVPTSPCPCYRDLPPDTAHGPYPLVLYAHGLTLLRWASVTLTAHWASHGFVVIAPDFPGARLADVLAGRPATNLSRSVTDAAAVLDAYYAAPPIPVTPQLALTGHSYGAELVSRLSATRGDVIIAMAERGVIPSARHFYTLVVGGTEDRVERWSKQQAGFQTSPSPKLLVPIPGAGHMSFTDICNTSPGLYAAAHAAGAPMTGFLAYLADRGCAQTSLTATQSWPPILTATTTALESSFCSSP